MKTIFELVKLVLDDLYKETVQIHGSEAAADKVIEEKIKYLSKKYTELTSKTSSAIDYKEPATRFAYVYKYVASHADYIFQVLEAYKKELDVLLQDSLRVSCIGGGPGSDILGLIKYLLSLEKEKNKITCYLCDQEQAWADSWTEIDDKINIENFSLNTNFQPLDVVDSDSWKYQKKFLEADVFTLSYFVSEISRFDKNDLDVFWDAIFGASKSGALFIFIDNAHTDFTSYFDSKWSNYKIKTIASGDTTLTPSYEEQLSVFANYLVKFPNKPKLKSQISIRLLLKE